MQPPRLISPRWLAPVADGPAVLTDHTVVLSGERIEAVLPRAQAEARYPQADHLILDQHLLTPGLINAHTHAAMSLLRGVADDLPLERWLHERIWPMEGAVMSEHFVYDGTVLACAEMLLGGTTTFNDMYFFPESTAQAALDLGMRATVGIIVIDFPSAYGSGPQDYLAKGLAVRDRLRHEPTITFTLAPHAPYSVSDAPLSEVARLSAELQLPVEIHIHETAREVADHEAQFGVRPLARLAALGLVGPELIGVHAVHLNESDMRLLADGGASVVHCPHSNLKLASGICPVTSLQERGINVGLGTDGSASNNRLDLLAEARTASLLAKGSTGDAGTFGAHQALRAATLSGARALGRQHELGSIEAGKLADLVAFDFAQDGLADFHDPVAHLLFFASSQQVSDVWIGGRPVVVKRQLTQTRALDALAKVRARKVVWHNRLGQFVPGNVRA
jgi:5-methylthioadenosine/S-adenosylhomocysteine deaminase